MAFTYQPINEDSFESLEDLKKFTKKEEEAIVRIPAHGFITNGAHFFDDECLGRGSSFFKFNKDGLRSFCSFLGIRLDTLELLERHELATDVLNDLLAQQTIQDKLRCQELIVNEENNEIIGMVSKSYIGYSNHQLLEDLDKFLYPKGSELLLFPEEENFTLNESYSINTHLSLRFIIKEKVGVTKGSGGTGEDVTKLGFQFKNSMIGNASLNVNFFLYRQVCANGLVAPAGSAVNRIFHSGKQENFAKRVENAFGEITRRIGKAGDMIKQLGALEFNPELLAKTNRSDMIFDIIQGSKGSIISEYKIPNTPRKNDKTEKINKKILRESKIIELVPQKYAGENSRQVFDSCWRDNASMFDFINVFTEHANTLTPQKKIEVQEKAGTLGDWIVQNKKKFKKKN